MSSKEDPDYEPTKFRKKELSSRDSKLSYIIFFSIVAVAIGILNVVLFTFPNPTFPGKRELYSCTNLNIGSIQSEQLGVWASVGIFSVLSFVIAPIAKTTTNAWSRQTSVFLFTAPFVALISLAIAGAAGILGYCAGYYEGEPIKSITDLPNHLKVLYALLDLLLVICELALFFLLLSAWFQIRSKRKRSQETKEKEDEEKLKKKTPKENGKETSSETPTQTDPQPGTSSAPVPTTSAPEKDNKTEQSPSTKTVPNVYFIQAPVQVAQPAPQPTAISNPLPIPQQQAMISPYSPYMNPGYYDPYDAPYYPIPPQPPPLPRPPPPPRRPGPRGPRFRPFRRGYGVRINRGYSIFPY